MRTVIHGFFSPKTQALIFTVNLIGTALIKRYRFFTIRTFRHDIISEILAPDLFPEFDDAL
jgi:hypothetical protein